MEHISTIIEKIYRDHNPEKISDIPNILEKYKGRETEMLIKLSVKYNLRLENYIPVDYLILVKAILVKYDPVNVSSASSLLEDFQYRERELLKVLNRKYNSDFNEIIISIYTTASFEEYPTEVIETKTSFFRELKFPEIEVLQRLTTKSFIRVFIGITVVIIALIAIYNSGIFRHHKIDILKISSISQNPTPINVPITETSQYKSPASNPTVETPINPNKESRTNEANSKQTVTINPYGPGNGKISIFKTCNDPEIIISIDGNYIGKLSQTFNSSDAPPCDASGTISKVLPSGRHHLSAENTLEMSWDIMITIMEGKCQQQEIKKVK